MDDPENINSFLRDLKDGSVISIKDMTVHRSQHFVFRNRRASFGVLFQSGDLMLNPGNESFCFAGAVLADRVPYFLQIPFSRAGDLNLVSNGHA